MQNALQSTDGRSHFAGDHVQDALPDLTTVQLHESLLRDVESGTGGVHSDDIDRHPRRRIGQTPAPAAVGRVPDHVERAADEGELGDIAERRETRGETVRPV